ncbi:MAG TPA: CHASE2 domain-containing protein [Coleofasciculaceae cyanobacterium]|jgi:CHASE2 domain-containing sensor protein
MTQDNSVFYLKVQQVGQACLFELSWGRGRGQQLNVTLPYPETLSTLYKEWNSIYLSFYNTALRGRVAAAGSIAPPPINWHAKLVQAEAKLLYEFHQWLRQGELYEIRSRIAQAARDWDKGIGGEAQTGGSPVIEVFLACNPLDLARLPWEAWEIGTEFATTGKIRFVRTPVNIQDAPVTPKSRRSRVRILAILGDETGLNFHADREAVQSLSSIADVQFIGWQPEKNTESLKSEIVNTITDEQGWDVLFFAGHSNETCLTGGELAIAPNISLNLSEITQPIKIAIKRGLRFALFNSCNGLSLANALINLGLSQVAVMREPIHNRVAEEFLVRFLKRLAEYQDVHESLLAACQYLKLEKQLTYPSAYLIPSLFRHPDAPPFRLQRSKLTDRLKCWLPTKREAIGLAALAIVSWQPSVQQELLEQRVLVQARYRQLTHQVQKIKEPPVLLVQVDEQSIRKAKMPYPAVPINRTYIAQLVDKLSAVNAKVIGIDYLLDRPHQDKTQDQKLAQSLRASVQKGTGFVLATMRHDGDWLGPMPELAHPNWSLQGDVQVFFRDRVLYATLVPRWSSEDQSLPFSYLLSLSYWLNSEHKQLAQPQLQSPVPWIAQLKAHVNDITGSDYKDLFSPSSRLHPLTNFFYPYRQMWLHPIIDFSIPPQQVYKRLPAWKLLESPTESLKLDPHQQPVVIIAPGGHSEAGINAQGEDNFRLPPATGYWRSQQNPPDEREKLPGGEIHAYLIHHFLNQRFVVPIPDLWMIVVAALLGKGAVIALENVKTETKHRNGKHTLLLLSSGRGKWVLAMASGTVIYGLVGLQFYITSAVLLPFVLPVATFWTYILLNQLQKKDHA